MTNPGGPSSLMCLFRRYVSHPRGELRYGVDTRNGRVAEFVVQLYSWLDGEWHLVAQFDHNPSLPGGHDVRSEGIHMDVFRGREKVETESANHPGPVKPAYALNDAINYLTEHAEPLIERYQRWRTE